MHTFLKHMMVVASMTAATFFVAVLVYYFVNQPALGVGESRLIQAASIDADSELNEAIRDEELPDGKGQASPEWVDGTGEDLRIRVTGEVFDENDKPASDYKLQASLNTGFGSRDLPAEIEGKRFQVWVPVESAIWSRMHFKATSADGHRIAQEMISPYELRQAAINGLKLMMKSAERSMGVTVVENGKPVADAFVTAKFESGTKTSGKTNDMGIATFQLMKRDKLSQLTAWTADFRIGGYSFIRKPTRNPLGDKHTIELHRCRPQKIRIINNEDQSPISNLDFILIIGTGDPNYQFLGQTPDCSMQTNEKGEAVFRWFPDWEKHGSLVHVSDPNWVKAMDNKTVDDTIVVRLRKSQFKNRKRVAGQVKSTTGDVAGFFVNINSFQGELKNQIDVCYAFTDRNGKFTANYLPGSTYCICINDARFVSNIIDVIPFEPRIDKANSPALEISAGQPVDIVVTSGPAKRPIAYQGIQLKTPHRYSWREKSKRRSGMGGRRWFVATDERGKARTFALPGKKIEGFLYTPEWQSKETVEVKTVGVTRLEFHQEVAFKRKIGGRLLLPENVAADLQGAVIQVGSVDGETNDRLTVVAKPDGTFSFESRASRIGIYASTKDSRASAIAVIDRLKDPIEIQLKPTGSFHGQLLGRNDQPVQGHSVRATVRVSGKRDYSLPFSTSFSATTIETKTDSDGNYTLTGLPYEATLRLSTDPIDGSDRKNYNIEIYLRPNESRSRAVFRLVKPEKKLSFAKRYEEILRDCRLSNFHSMVILYRPADDTKQFVDANLLDDDKTKEVRSFMQLEVQVGDQSAGSDFISFGQSKTWPMPKKGQVFACAIDAAGKELGRIKLDSEDSEGAKLAAQFIRQHAPKQLDAKKKWDKAFATAKQTNRKVWVRISQRYCGPCFLLARWLDDQKENLEQDYVLLKIDNVGDLHGYEIAKRITRGEHHGVPFHAIFDAEGKMLIDSKSPLGNIGHPRSFEGSKHLRKMLTQTRGKLTDKQIDEIIASLND